MLPIYLAAAAFGMVLIGASVIFGGKDLDHDADGGIEVDKDIDLGHAHIGDAHVDMDVDMSGDVDADGDIDLAETAEGASKEIDFSAAGDAAELLIFNPFLSLRFWTYFAASFGGIGAVLSLLQVSDVVHIPSAIIMGLGIGYGSASVFRMLKMRSSSSETRSDTLIGTEAEVVLDIQPGKAGKVRTKLGGSVAEFKAESQDDLKRGDKVLLISLEGHVVQVIRMPSLEDLSETEAARKKKRAALQARQKRQQQQ
jgi:membrane protein implicated in regulation of membrane protease activity